MKRHRSTVAATAMRRIDVKAVPWGVRNQKDSVKHKHLVSRRNRRRDRQADWQAVSDAEDKSELYECQCYPGYRDYNCDSIMCPAGADDYMKYCEQNGLWPYGEGEPDYGDQVLCTTGD